MEKSRVVVFGHKGMLGQELMKAFSDAEVFGFDREDVDITNAETVEKKISELRPHIIINAAAYNAVDACEENAEFEKAKLLNATAPGLLAKAAKDAGAKFVHYSTDYVFDGEKKEGYVESDEPNPISRYGESKLMGERSVAAMGGEWYLIRTCKMFGQPASSEVAKKSFVDTMLALAETRDELEVVNEEWASPTYAPDLAAQTRALLEGGYPSGIYHATNDGACTWYEFAQEIFRIIGKNIKLIPVFSDAFPRPAKRPKFSRLLNTKLPPLRSWQEALEEYLSETLNPKF